MFDLKKKKKKGQEIPSVFTFLNSVHSSTRVLHLLMNFSPKLSEILLLWLSDMHMRYRFLPKKHLPVYNFRKIYSWLTNLIPKWRDCVKSEPWDVCYSVLYCPTIHGPQQSDSSKTSQWQHSNLSPPGPQYCWFSNLQSVFHPLKDWDERYEENKTKQNKKNSALDLTCQIWVPTLYKVTLSSPLLFTKP